MLDDYGREIYKAVQSRLKAMVILGDDIFKMSPEDLVRENLFDPVQLFIKNEPHKNAKIVTGKLRLISGVSLVDQIITRALCGSQNRSEINEWQTCASKPGLGLDDDSLKVLSASIKQMLDFNPIAETDISGWDWSVQEWELMLDAERRRRLAGAEKDSVFAHLLRVHAYSVGHSVYCTPRGVLLATRWAGGQLSGDYNTSSSNSAMRILAGCVARIQSGAYKPRNLVCVADCKINTYDPGQSCECTQSELDEDMFGFMAMGDDCLESAFSGMKEAYEKLGHTVKMCNVRTQLAGVSFCSHEFEASGRAFPEGYLKTLYRFLSHKPGDPRYMEWEAQLSYVLRHLSPEKRTKYMNMANARVELAKRLWLEEQRILAAANPPSNQLVDVSPKIIRPPAPSPPLTTVVSSKSSEPPIRHQLKSGENTPSIQLRGSD